MMRITRSELKNSAPKFIRIVAVAIALIVFCVAGVAFGLNKSEWASWVQAVGSIVAIAVSLRIAKDQFDRAELTRASASVMKELEDAQAKGAERREAQQIAFQLIVRADLAMKKLLESVRNPANFGNLRTVLVSGVADMESVHFGLQALDYRNFPKYDLFDLCIQTMGDVAALREHLAGWLRVSHLCADVGLIAGYSKTLSESVQEYQRLTGTKPLERTYRASVVSMAPSEVGSPTIVAMHQSTSS
jgi:hypothetical protein